jgi:hypothetical protein
VDVVPMATFGIGEAYFGDLIFQAGGRRTNPG